MGLICVCIPTVGTLARRRRLSHREHTMLDDGISCRRTSNTRNKRHSASLSKTGLFVSGAPALGRLSKLATPPPAVITNVSGGLHSGCIDGTEMEMSDEGFAESREEVNRAHAIFTSVRMEQSYCWCKWQIQDAFRGCTNSLVCNGGVSDVLLNINTFVVLSTLSICKRVCGSLIA